MRYYLIVGQCGVGKSSFINATFGDDAADTHEFEACTKLTRQYARTIRHGDICLIDTPGLAENGEDLDRQYLRDIKKIIHDLTIEAMVYVTPLIDPRFRPTEKRTIELIIDELSDSLFSSAWLVFTFAASASSEKRNRMAANRTEQLRGYIRDRLPHFVGFRKEILIDNVVCNWSQDCLPADDLFV